MMALALIGLAGVNLLLLAGFIALAVRFIAMRRAADHAYATGALDADQASSLRGDLARRRAVSAQQAAEIARLRHALNLALDELAAARRAARLFAEAADDAVAEAGA